MKRKRSDTGSLRVQGERKKERKQTKRDEGEERTKRRRQVQKKKKKKGKRKGKRAKRKGREACIREGDMRRESEHVRDEVIHHAERRQGEEKAWLCTEREMYMCVWDKKKAIPHSFFDLLLFFQRVCKGDLLFSLLLCFCTELIHRHIKSLFDSFSFSHSHFYSLLTCLFLYLSKKKPSLRNPCHLLLFVIFAPS